MIVINFKTYEESSGADAINLVKAIESVASGRTVPIIPAVSAIDLKEIADITSLPVWVQNIDPITYGAHTGMTLAEEAVRLGAQGTLLNHSENKYTDFEKLEFAISHAQNIGLQVLVFAGDLDELKKILEFKPNFASYEPPEFIGSTTTSVAEAKPEIISQAAEICKAANIPLVVGAGIHSTKDVKVSLELGASGIAIATGIVKAEDPAKELQALLEGFK